MASSEIETISLDHIHREPVNPGEQLSITGSRDLLTAAIRPPRSRQEELWSFLLLLQWQSSRQCSLENKFRNTLVIIGKVSTDVPQFLLFIKNSTIKTTY